MARYQGGGALRGTDRRFSNTQTQEDTMKHTPRSCTQVLEESIIDTILDIQMYNTEMSPVYGRGRRKFIRNRNNITTPGGRTEQDIEARPTTEDDPIIITVIDQSVIPI